MLSNFAELASIGVRLFCEEVFTDYLGKSQFISLAMLYFMFTKMRHEYVKAQ
jgi:hypothetical protein